MGLLLFKRNRACTRLLIVLAMVSAGCSNGIPAAYEKLTQSPPTPNSQAITLDDFVAILTADQYDTVRDSLVSHLDENASIVSHLSTIDSTGVAADVDTLSFSVQKMQNDLDGVGWIGNLLPEGQIFLTARNTEQFVYRSSTDTDGVTCLRADAVPGQDLPGGLQSISVYLTGSTVRQITRIEVERDGGGLFFREKSLLEMGLDGQEEFDNLEYTVVLKLPFRGIAAYQTVSSVVDGAA